MQKTGYLNLPLISKEPLIDYPKSRFSDLFVIYSKFVEKSSFGQKMLTQFESDARLKKYIDKMISTGNGARRFEFLTLTMWYLWNYNENGQAVADSRLDSFINSDKYLKTSVLWITGLNIESKIELNNGYCIVPISEMFESPDKEIFSSIKFHSHQLTQYPEAAIVKNYMEDIISEDHKTVNPKSEWRKTSIELNDIATLINCIDESHCTQSYSTAYGLESPFWPFSGSGGGSPIFDVSSFNTSKFNLDNTQLLNDLIHKFSFYDDDKKQRYYRILNRMSQAKRRLSIEDKILDLAIALEMILLGNGNKDQLSLSFRLRGSWFLEKTPIERKKIYDKLKNLYNYRSEIAHTGLLCKNNHQEIGKIQADISSYISVADRIVQKSILDGIPDWDNLILGLE